MPWHHFAGAEVVAGDIVSIYIYMDLYFQFVFYFHMQTESEFELKFSLLWQIN